MTDVFQQYSKSADQSPPLFCYIGGGGWQGSGWRHEGFQWEFGGQTWRLKTSEVRCPPVTWCDFPLLSPLITVSDGKWWKGGGGVMKRWRDLGRKGWSHSMMRLCVKCNEPGNEPRGISPFWSYFTANPVDLLHLGKAYTHTWHVCVHVYCSHQ